MSVETELPSGWRIKQIWLDQDGRDILGWNWGLGLPLWYATDGWDSVTVRAPTEAEAVAEMAYAGWPPKTVCRLNWEYTGP